MRRNPRSIENRAAKYGRRLGGKFVRTWTQLVLGLLVLLAGLACAPQPPQKQSKNVKVTVVAILASTKSMHIDPCLKCIAEEVQKKHPRFTGFRVEVTTRRSLPVGKKSAFELVDKEVAEVVIVHGANAKNWVDLKVTPPRQGEIEYGTVCGKFLPIFTSYDTKDQERLIIAIRVEPCHGRK
jgi:hypothetical protein